ncbi:MAG: hypothetical protein HY425_02670 [Candidatus Levybacteria bacterium]|nr:hypothetical protein [Candidatus Levybacteria bacterium]
MMETLSPLEGGPKNLQEYKQFFSSPENDLTAFHSVDKLRGDVESLRNWGKTKVLAEQEIADLPQDIMHILIDRFSAFIDNLPAGHSRGHFERDLISSIIFQQDPYVGSLDAVERLVGILGGTFHDIGNSVVNRHEETKRFCSHAEVSAYLFGEIAKDIIPENLMKLTQFSIAAHTHYLEEIPVEIDINGEKTKVVKKPYDVDLVDGNKAGVWLTQWADRLDAQGFIMFVRHGLTKIKATENYASDQGFHQASEDQDEDFRHHFNPKLRSDENRQREQSSSARNILEHIKMFADSGRDRSASVYSQHDSDFYSNNLTAPSREEQQEFTKAVLDKEKASRFSEEDSLKAVDVFKKIAGIIEPGADIEEVLKMFDNKFNLLTLEERKQWSNGFSVLPELHKKWYERTRGKLNLASEVIRDNPLFLNAWELAREKLENFRPIDN